MSWLTSGTTVQAPTVACNGEIFNGAAPFGPVASELGGGRRAGIQGEVVPLLVQSQSPVEHRADGAPRARHRLRSGSPFLELVERFRKHPGELLDG